MGEKGEGIKQRKKTNSQTQTTTVGDYQKESWGGGRRWQRWGWGMEMYKKCFDEMISLFIDLETFQLM